MDILVQLSEPLLKPRSPTTESDEIALLVFLYIFVWPLLMPLIWVAVLSLIPRSRVLRTAALLALVTAATAAPLVYIVQTSPHPEGLGLSSLSLYPASLVLLAATAGTRMLLPRLRARSR